MNLCDICRDPATHSSLLSERGKESVHRFLCYVHAAEADLLDIPVPTLSAIAEHAGYTVNAVVFVLESLVRADLVDVTSSTGPYDLLSDALNVSEVCRVVKASTVNRFGRDAEAVIELWDIPAAGDVGAILLALVEGGILRPTGSQEVDTFRKDLGEVEDRRLLP
jgi:uncharacterized repeat protein (TIGR04138 family)